MASDIGAIDPKTLIVPVLAIERNDCQTRDWGIKVADF